MKKSLLLAALALTLTASYAMAGGKGGWTGGGQAGAALPMGDFKDVGKTGFLGGVFIDYGVTEMFTLGANLDYISTKAKDEVITAFGVDDIKFTIFNYGVNGAYHFMPAGTVHPYLKGGVGIYSLKTEVELGGVTGDDTESKVGFAGGGGLMFQPAGSAIGFGAEALFHNINTEGSSTQIVSATARISFSFSDPTQ